MGAIDKCWTIVHLPGMGVEHLKLKELSRFSTHICTIRQSYILSMNVNLSEVLINAKSTEQ